MLVICLTSTVKIGCMFMEIEGRTSSVQNIIVQDIEFQDEPILRSGRLLANRKRVLYRINKNNNNQIVSAEEIKFLKRILGPDALTYSESFSSPEKQKYVI